MRNISRIGFRMSLADGMRFVIARSRVEKRAGRRSNLTRIPATRRHAEGQVLKPDPPETRVGALALAGIRGRLLRQANPENQP